MLLGWWTQDENRKADKQTRHSVRLRWYQRCFRQFWWDRCFGLLISQVFDPIRRSLLPFLSSYKSLTRALTNLWTSYNAGCFFYSGCLVVWLLIMFGLCFSFPFTVVFRSHYLHLFNSLQSSYTYETVLPSFSDFQHQTVSMHQLVVSTNRKRKENINMMLHERRGQVRVSNTIYYDIKTGNLTPIHCSNVLKTVI